MYRAVLIAVAATLIGITALICADAVLCAATLHVRRSVAAAPLNAATVEIAAVDKVKLSGWWLRAPAPNGNCVIVLHGITDSRSGSVGFAPMFLAQGYEVLAPDSRAHGASGGQFVTYGLLEKYDVITWAHWMRSQGCDKLYALGESLGASILIQAAAVEPVFSAIVAESPFADLQEIARYRVRRMLPLPAFIAIPAANLLVSSSMLYAKFVDGVDLGHVSPLLSITETPTPILLIHGLDDVNTPPSHSRELAAAATRNPLWLVPKARHAGAAATEPGEFRKRVLGWFSNH